MNSWKGFMSILTHKKKSEMTMKLAIIGNPYRAFFGMFDRVRTTLESRMPTLNYKYLSNQ